MDSKQTYVILSIPIIEMGKKLQQATIAADTAHPSWTFSAPAKDRPCYISTSTFRAGICGKVLHLISKQSRSINEKKKNREKLA
jgi:hypothetical protein